MKYQWIVPLIAAAGNVVVGVLVLSRNRRHPLNVTFAVLAALLVLWNLNIFGFYFFDTPEAAFRWARVFRVGTLLVPAAVVTFVYVFAERREFWRRFIVCLCVGLSVFLVIANAFDLVVAEVRWFGWGYYSVGTKLYNLLTLNFIIGLVYPMVVLLSELRLSDSPRKRVQIRLWLLAGAIAIPLGLTNLLPAYGFRMYPLGNLANVVYTAIVAYGIVRYRLMDIDIVITAGVAYAAVSLAVIAPAFCLTLWLERLSFGEIHPGLSAVILLMFVVVGVLFPTLRLQAQSRIERSLFREKHEHRIALIDFTRSILTILDRDRLVRELATTLSETLNLDRIVIALLDEAKRAFTVRYALGIPAAAEEFPEKHELIGTLTRSPEVILRDELEASAHDHEEEVAVEVCRRNGWEVCMPLTVNAKLIGFIALGRKSNLDAFFAGDLDLLGALAAEASIALENARLYEELKKSQDIIRRADRLSALGTLAAGIAHEVRNPLVSIQTFFQLAPERLHDEEFLTTFLSLTANEVTRISDLITELLSFARSPTRTLSPVNLNDAVDRVATLLEPEARKHRLTLTRTPVPGLPVVQADPDQIKQVLINLVLNAIQATQPDGSVSIITRMVEHHNTTFGQVEVRDTGVGIPKEQLDHIFNPFFTTKDKGTGLGLAIAHQIVTEHGGIITVESQEGRGTSLFIDLPACDQAGLAEESDSVAHRYERRRMVAS